MKAALKVFLSIDVKIERLPFIIESMKLIKLKIKNYRCYQKEVSIDIDDLTCIIGRNDIGKSSIMEALDAFFNANVDKSDLSVDADDQQIDITCIFSQIPSEIVLDTSASCSMADEGLLNADGMLEIKREFDFSGAKVAKTTYVMGNSSDAPEVEGILNLKNATLKLRAAELQVDLTGVNQRINKEIRAAIRNKFASTNSVKPIKVEGNLNTEDNIKVVWNSISKILPTFALFKMDRALNDKDGGVQDPMKLAVDLALKNETIVQKLSEIEDFVRQETTTTAESTIQHLATFDKKLAESMKSAFAKQPKWSSVFDVTLLNDKDIPLNKRGSGVRRLILLSFFQAQAEKVKIEKGAPSIIYAIEEPETSQHPDHQLEIVKNLIDLSLVEETQVLFTTHSSNLVKEIPLASLRFILYDDANEITVSNGVNEDGTNNEEILDGIVKTLGVLPNPLDEVRFLLFVEGNNDIEALKGYSRILFDANEIDEDIMNSEKVGIVITGGSSLRYYIENKYLSGLGKPEIHIYDNDKEDYRNLVARVNNENNPNKVAYNTSKYEMENFLCSDAIKEFYAANGINNLVLPEIDDNMDVPQEVCKANNPNWENLDEELKHKKESNVKRKLNREIVKNMTIERLEARGAKDELKIWFDKMIDFC